jgi:hypothetical protein
VEKNKNIAQEESFNACYTKGSRKGQAKGQEILIIKCTP